MKVASKLAILLGMGLSAATFASAKSLEQTYLDNCRKGPGVPVPISVVAPQVDSDAIGEKAEVEFTVTAAGKPSEISIRSATDREFAQAVITAVKQWQFTPAQKDGVPVATK